MKNTLTFLSVIICSDNKIKKNKKQLMHTNLMIHDFICALLFFSSVDDLCESGSMGASTEPQQPPRDPFLQLISVQKASGCWVLDPALAAALGKTSEEVESPKPASVGYCQI